MMIIKENKCFTELLTKIVHPIKLAQNKHSKNAYILEQYSHRFSDCQYSVLKKQYINKNSNI